MPTFTNQASLNYNNNVILSNVVEGEITSVLDITKQVLPTTYQQNSVNTYVITLINTSNQPLTNITLTDNLGNYTFNTATLTPLDYVENTLGVFYNGAPTTYTISSTSPLTITGITIPANSNVVVVFEATPNSYANTDSSSSITNTATASSPTIDEVSAAVTTTPTSSPILSIEKAVNPTTVAENGTITYTFTIRNSGNTPITTSDNVILSDTFTPVLSNISVSMNQTPLTLGTNYTYNQTTGVFNTIAGTITVPALTTSQDQTSGVVSQNPGLTTITVTGNIA